MSGRGPVLGTGLAPAEPPHGGEPDAGGGFALDGGEVRCPVILGVNGERLRDLGSNLLGGFLGSAEHSGALVVLCPVGGALGVEACGDLLPPLRLPFGTLGFVVEAGEFFGDECDRPVCDEATHGLLCDVRELSTVARWTP